MIAVMKIFGAIIAGGKSRRFGSDKALALHDNRRLIDIVADSLIQQVDTVVICGRDLPGFQHLPDRPIPGLGPLGGLSASLHHANLNGYDAVLSVATDILPLPLELFGWLSNRSENNTRATVVAGQHIIGLWPAALADRLDDHLAQENNRSIHGWIIASNAVAVDTGLIFHNINTAHDLTQFAET
jgi:molybdopterin-guanine dinucleotide biosynthesis protein A